MEEIELRANENKFWSFPKIEDPDSDKIETPEIKLDQATPFTKIKDANTLIFSPEAKNEGSYTIRIILKDKNPTGSLS